VYLVLKLVHVAAVIAFVGNISIGIFWKHIADRTRAPGIIAHTMQGIIGADRIFTIPAIVVLLVAGIGAAQVGHIPILGTGWILWSIVLFIIAGLAFGPIARAQRQMRDLALAGSAGASMDWTRYEALSKRWAGFGLVATIAPLVAVAFMVLKPALPAFHP
jgi:uncharacterized membrane protein